MGQKVAQEATCPVCCWSRLVCLWLPTTVSQRESGRGCLCHTFSVDNFWDFLGPQWPSRWEMLSWVEDTAGTISASWAPARPPHQNTSHLPGTVLVRSRTHCTWGTNTKHLWTLLLLGSRITQQIYGHYDPTLKRFCRSFPLILFQCPARAEISLGKL